MANTPKNLYSNDGAPTSLTTVYTVPAATNTIVTCITIVNKNTTPKGVTILFDGLTITYQTARMEPYKTYILQLNHVLGTGKFIQVAAETNTAGIAVGINGVEVT